MRRESPITAPEATPPPQPEDRRRERRWSLLAGWDSAVIVVLIIMFVAAAVLVDNFANPVNISFLLLDVAAIALIAMPMTLIIVTGEIDLSVASALGLTSAVMGQLWFLGVSLETAMVLSVLLGGVLGALNGAFVTRFGLPSLAVTIGTLALYRGLAFVVLGDRAVADFPPSWTQAVTSSTPGLPLPWVVIPLIAFAVIFGVVLHATPVGRGLYAIGNSDEASVFSGIDVAWTKFWLFVTTGVMSAVAGVYWTLRFASARADNAVGLELAVIAAVLLGGVSIFGGTGTLTGVLAGVLLLGTLTNALQLANVSADVVNVVTGVLLIISVLAPNVLTAVRGARRRSRPTRATS